MKSKTITLLISGLSIFLIIQSCRYDEGPVISFRSPEKRLTGHWVVNTFKIYDVDCTDVYRNKCDCSFGFVNPENTYISCNSGVNIYMKYFLGGSGKTLTIDLGEEIHGYPEHISYFGPIGTGKKSSWTIHKLMNTKLKISTTYEGVDYTLELEK